MALLLFPLTTLSIPLNFAFLVNNSGRSTKTLSTEFMIANIVMTAIVFGFSVMYIWYYRMTYLIKNEYISKNCDVQYHALNEENGEKGQYSQFVNDTVFINTMWGFAAINLCTLVEYVFRLQTALDDSVSRMMDVDIATAVLLMATLMLLMVDFFDSDNMKNIVHHHIVFFFKTISILYELVHATNHVRAISIILASISILTIFIKLISRLEGSKPSLENKETLLEKED